MANYYGVTRTNYFKVTNEDAFVELMDRCKSDDFEGVSVWTNESEDGAKTYGFGCYGCFEGIKVGEDEDAECDFSAFVSELQKLLPEGEAVIITHAGHEKLRYIGGGVTVITKDKVEYRYLSKIGLNLAKEMLDNPNWVTQNEY